MCSKAFVFAALGLTVATFWTGMDEFSYDAGNDLIYIYGYLSVCFAVCGDTRAALFCADWENRFVARSDDTAKGIACFVSAVLVVVVSEWLHDLTALGLSGGEHGKRNSPWRWAFDEIGYSGAGVPLFCGGDFH